MLSVEKIQINWENFLSRLTSCTEKNKDRQKKILEFYDSRDERFSMMPAAGNVAYHNAFPGGYIDHVIRVASCSMSLLGIWNHFGAFTQDFTVDELTFAALNHDLGKFGDDSNEYYIKQDSDWHYKRGEIFKHNPSLQHMDVHDRSLYILQSLGIQLSNNEYLAIKLHDGLYDEGNKSYYVTYNADKRLRSNMPYILHQGDLMASRIEFDLFHKKTNKTVIEIQEGPNSGYAKKAAEQVINSEVKIVSKKTKYSDILNKL